MRVYLTPQNTETCLTGTFFQGRTPIDFELCPDDESADKARVALEDGELEDQFLYAFVPER